MAGENQKIEFEIDVGDTLSQLKGLSGSMEALNGAMTNLQRVSQSISTTGVVTQIWKAQSDAGKDLTVVTKGLGDALKVTRITAVESAAAHRAQAQALREQAAAAQELLSKQANAAIRTQLPVPSNATQQQLAAYETKVASIANQVGKGNLSLGSATAIAEAVRLGQTYDNLTAAEARAQQGLVGIKTGFEKSMLLVLLPQPESRLMQSRMPMHSTSSKPSWLRELMLKSGKVQLTLPLASCEVSSQLRLVRHLSKWPLTRRDLLKSIAPLQVAAGELLVPMRHVSVRQ